jgi:hypothetical protein
VSERHGLAVQGVGRFATGSAIFSTSRQLGVVVGIATLVAVLGTPNPDNVPHTHFNRFRPASS